MPSRGARPDILQEAGLSAPMGGINMLTPAVQQPPTDCVYCYNLTARERGLGPRLGSQEYVAGLDGPPLTVLPLKGAQAGDDRLFVTTQTGIWDCTSKTSAPTQVVAFGNVNAFSGYGVSTVIVDLNTGHNLLYTDESNGYYVYSAASTTWTKVTMGAGANQIANVDPATFAFVMSWKNQVIFVQKDTGYAWYLDTFLIYGAATKFNFGTRFAQGGSLVGLWDYTQTGGLTPNDYLVAISGGGDVVIYGGSAIKGTDFSIVGVWSVGDVPAGRKIASNFGGDLLIISARGAVPLSKLCAGAVQGDTAQYATQKIPTLIQQLMGIYRRTLGWQVVLSPEDGTLLVLVPDGTQLVMNLATKAWSQYRGLNMTCAAAWNGQLFYGAGTSVFINTGTVDGMMLADPNSFMPIEFSLLTSFQAYGTARLKQVQMIRTTMQNPGGQMQFETRALYGYDDTEPPPVTFSPVGSNQGVWDSALWDQAVWSGAAAPVRGYGAGIGIGPEFAIALRGTAISKVVLIGWHVFYTVGGRM